jgi:hypothetical protein
VTAIFLTPALTAALAAVDRAEKLCAEPEDGFLPLEMALVRLGNEVRRTLQEQPRDQLRRLPAQPKPARASLQDRRKRGTS